MQIEGSAGRGDSIWDAFCRDHPERVFEAATPAVACDHVNRWQEDVQWMARLGHTGYRMSICWPRVQPDGQWSEAGLAFYDRLFDALLAVGIQPNVTLYHWDLPAGMTWEDPSTVDRFVSYATGCFERYGDRVRLWSTLNEPGWSTLNGYVTGLHPPLKQDWRAAIQVSHHLMLAHGRVVERFHSLGLKGIGIALNLSAVRPATPADEAAAVQADGILNRWFIEPVLRGRYPEDISALYRQCGLLPTGDSLSGDRVDWVGVNYYYPHHATADAPETSFHLNTSGEAAEACDFAIEGQFRMVRNPRGRYSDWAWEIDADGLYELLLPYRDIPVYVTENGLGRREHLANGEVDDQERIDFVRDHLRAVERALAAGIDVRGYYMWSLMDNFSWINGYKKRYGFLYVDRETLERTPKKSAWWFRDVIRRGQVDAGGL
ncbi:MAG TPA: family 1 glycosylhydrolase [Candidatus Xenobia bacterium]